MQIKGLLPALRERKRYLAFEIISKKPIHDFKKVSNSIWNACFEFMGVLNCNKAGIIIMKDKFNISKQKGILRINNKMYNEIQTSLSMINEIEKIPILINTIGMSAILKKCEQNIL